MQFWEHGKSGMIMEPSAGRYTKALKSSALMGVLVFSLAACTTTDEIIIDQKGVDMSRYEQDLAECKTYASEVKTGGKAAKGAVSGAVVGGLIGAAVGNSRDAQRAAGAGAVTGGARGVREGEQTEIQVVKRCLIGRGYRVLN
jgi:outer membrane lipoprotein SlyB